MRTVSCRLCWNHWFSRDYARRKQKLTLVPPSLKWTAFGEKAKNFKMSNWISRGKEVERDKFGADLGLGLDWCVNFREARKVKFIARNSTLSTDQNTFPKLWERTYKSSFWNEWESSTPVRVFQPLKEFRRTFPLHARRTAVRQKLFWFTKMSKQFN